MDQVLALLGHRPIKVTERHYAPRTKARQDQMERRVMKSWEDDRLIVTTGIEATGKGTSAVRKNAMVN